MPEDLNPIRKPQIGRDNQRHAFIECGTEGEQGLRALETLRPQLPMLIGQEWPEFTCQLHEYLSQIAQRPEREPLLRAQILRLFANCRGTKHTPHAMLPKRRYGCMKYWAFDRF